MKIRRDFSAPFSKLHNDTALSTLSYWNEFRYIMKECDLRGTTDLITARDDVEQAAKISGTFQGCAERLRSLPIRNIDAELVDLVTTATNMADAIASIFNQVVPLLREESVYRSRNQPMPSSLIYKQGEVIQRMQRLRGDMGTKSIYLIEQRPRSGFHGR